MQALCRMTVADVPAWRTAFDGDTESRANAGLSVLQIWTEDDAPGTVWVLFDVNDPARGRAFATGGQSRLHAERAGVTAAEWHFVRTA